ncbi:hypothetical protein DVA67_020440 [Solirubrobacter sp. CPCC 204708]|uniref:DUF222 domain-containing protein n=1 Tax=Solirubrobacter deserti TaxID=2282478 RepID=A0ABT4RNI5_9ACTN|nr:hypothetical protein [Solirubrobacter deserti]MBE2318362.1 hypothetical protein [Solirubrobacter deserti]MDA0140118.1 hypothetical protein [Solirubrobacter deserti]
MHATTRTARRALELAQDAVFQGRLAEAHRHMRAAEHSGADVAALAALQRQLNRRRAADRGMERLAELERARVAGVPAAALPRTAASRDGLRVSAHVVDRWRERIGAADRAAANAAIEEFARMGRITGERPRWSSNRARPGTRYVLWHEQPGVALVVIEGVVATVLTRENRRRRPRRRG